MAELTEFIIRSPDNGCPSVACRTYHQTLMYTLWLTFDIIHCDVTSFDLRALIALKKAYIAMDLSPMAVR